MKNRLQLGVLAVAFTLIGTNAWADVTGTVWQVAGNAEAVTCYLTGGACGTNLDGGSPPASEGTFTAKTIDFETAGDTQDFSGMATIPANDTLGGFLTSDAGNLLTNGVSVPALGEIMSGSQAGTANQYDKNGDGGCYGNGGQTTGTYDNATGCYNTVIEVTGTATFVHGQTYTITHDDGVTLSIAGYNSGNDVYGGGAVGPNAAENSDFTYTGTTGSYAFTLWYDGTNGNPEDLVSNINTPEPGAATMLFAMLIGVAGLAGLLKKKTA